MTTADDRLEKMDAALARIRQMGQTQALEADAVSYGLLSFDLEERWDETVTRFRSLVEQLSHFASAESYLESGIVARSAIGWTGNWATAWAPGVAPEQRQAHFAALQANLRYRARIILIVTAALQSAASLCAAAASPLMAPAAFCSVANLVSELQALC